MNQEQLIYSMLTENTGKHFLDSGGIDSRSWQQNQKKTLEDFKNEEPVSFDVDSWTDKDTGKTEYYPLLNVSVFHYMNDVLEQDEICEAFNALPCEDWDCDVYGISQEQKDWLENKGFETSAGHSWNSYNGDDSLSQTIQGTPVINNGSAFEYPEYLLLQIHGGCDVRGGYTDAKLFKLGAWQEYFSPDPNITIDIDGESFDYQGEWIKAETGEYVEKLPIKKDSKIKAYPQWEN